MAISLVDIAWAAGFLEGEGCFAVAKTCVRVSACQVQREPLNKLASLFGGNINLKLRNSINPSHKDIYIWYLPSRGSVEVAMTVYAFMSSKRRYEIEKMLD